MIPVGPPPLHAANLRVSDLISTSDHTWNWSTIKQYLPMYEPHIRRLELGFTRHVDSLVWLRNNNGIYTTGSGYGLKNSVSASPQFHNFNWQIKLWRIRAQPKLKTFLLKAAVGALAINDQLATLGIGNTTGCIRCGCSETIEHVLFHCSWAKLVWDLAPLSPIDWNSIDTMLDFLMESSRAMVLPPIGITNASMPA
ncbi:unnamed protein product [Arabis nemorensis]|uniref:Reverse transcriptase zinc-binding domain-containing protein n=1 Tax=Arabis nemorensis TaxID=586526 RepID=A0A565CPL7_9BRAS|nr:unnamed protein product [Arabis nemorensis]